MTSLWQDARTPYDGRPYYCEDCGLGFGEVLACELADCHLESVADALKRQREHNALKKAKRAAESDR